MLKTSVAGRRLIKSFEGFRSKSAPLPGGRWVIGYGHTKSAREGVEITEDDADKLLIYDLLAVEAAIDGTVAVPLSQNQFDALASLTLNIGQDNFRDSVVAQRLNAGRHVEAALAFDQWRGADLDGRTVVVEALLRRRAAERALFLTAEDGTAAAPSPEVVAVTENGAPGLSAPLIVYHPDLTDGVGRFDPPPTAPEESGESLEAVLPSPASDAPADSDLGRPEASLVAALPLAERALDEDELLDVAYVANAQAAHEPAPDEPAEAPEVAGDAPAGLETPESAVKDAAGEAAPAAPVALAAPDAIVGTDAESIVEDAPAGAVRAGAMSWAELAREREKLRRSATDASADAAPDGDPVLRAETEWSAGDDADDAPDPERGAIWYALFLLIGSVLAGFGVWDTVQRARGMVADAFVYGPAIAAAGVLFMAIAGWFLIKRVLAVR